MKKIEKPVFIFSLHRSGSTYLKNILDASSELKMLEDEVHFDHPFFFDTFRKYYQKFCKDRLQNYDKFLEIISEKKIRGAFWDHYKNQYGNFYSSKNFLSESQAIDVWDAFNSILRQLLYDSGKSRIGIKYPAHHKFYRAFQKEYPDAKNIFLVRDPRAIIASKIISPSNNRLKNKNKLKYEIMRLITVFYFIFEFNSFAKIIANNNSNRHLIEYENLVINRDEQIRDLCNFVDIKTSSEMLSANGKDSGYVNKSNIGDRINRWVLVLRKYEKILIDRLTLKSRHNLGYE
ncbi:MAG: sulfotransferase [Desulfosalsimonas sp.]